jgi:hypothetical protein
MRIMRVGVLKAQLAELCARSDDGARSGKLYQQILELRRAIARLEQRKQPIDRSFIQQAWPLKHKRRK